MVRLSNPKIIVISRVAGNAIFTEDVIPRLACPVKREACFTGDRGIQYFKIILFGS
jgi:hypothetical protein